MRTNKKTLTPAGTQRKIDRLICRQLKEKDEKMYAAFKKKALAVCKQDNDSITSVIVDTGLGVVHHQSPELAEAKAKQRAQLAALLEAGNE